MKTLQDVINFCKSKSIGAGDNKGKRLQGIVKDYENGTYPYRKYYEEACKQLGKEPLPWAP